jgi:hypothetical protein
MWSDAARRASAEARRRKKILNQPVDALRRNKSGMLVIKKVAPSNRFKASVMKLVRHGGHSMFPSGVSQKEFNRMLDQKYIDNGQQLSPELRRSRAAEQRAADKFKPRKRR